MEIRNSKFETDPKLECSKSQTRRSSDAAGAARVLPEEELTAERLALELDRITSDAERLRSMRDAALERARPNATADIAKDIATFLPPARRAA